MSLPKPILAGLLSGLVCLWSALASAASHQAEPDWFARVWQSDEGLPNNNVTSVGQTPDGFLWLGTAVGLVRFDGVRFDLVASSTFIVPPNRGVMKVAPGRSGGLWLAMDRGAVVSLNKGRAQIWTTTNGLPDALAVGMVEADDGTLWIQYLGGAIVSLKENLVTTWSPTNGGPAAGFMSSVAQDTEGRVWLARGGELGMMSDGKFTVVARTGTTATRIAAARSGGLWVSAGLRLLRCNEKGELKLLGEISVDRSGVNPTALLEDGQGALWVGTSYGGLFRFDGWRFEKVGTSHPEILSLMEDTENNIWVGTHGGGLNRLRPRAIRLETVESGLPFEAVQSVCEDDQGAIWVVTGNGLVARRVNERWTTITTNAGWPGGVPACVAAGVDNEVWIGTRTRRLVRWKDGRFESWTRGRGVEATTILTLLLDRTGTLWLGGQNSMVQSFKDGVFQRFDVPDDTRVIRATAEDANGVVWFGSSKGLLLRVEGNRLVDETRLMGPIFRSIRTLHATPDGSLWIGFAGWGVGRLKQGRFALIGAEQGLYDQYISQIASDGRGSLWFGGDRGLFKVRQEELDLVAEGRARRVRSIHYGRGEGLPSLHADMGYMPSATRSSDGRLWFPTRSGLAVLDPGRQWEASVKPPVLLKRIALDEETIAEYAGVLPAPHPTDPGELTSFLRLPPGHRKLQFDFTALSFTAPENVRFQYRLENFDGNWIEGGAERTATYSRLPAGQYRFRVRASNSSGLWNDEGAVLAFTVVPFVWQTWWFRAGMLVLIGSVMVFSVRYVFFRRLRLRLRLLEQEAALHKERSRIARDLHDDLGSRLTRLVLLSDLLQDEKDSGTAFTNAQEVSAAARQVIKALDETVWAVNPRNDTLPHLVDYIGQFAVEFLRTAGIRCRVDLPPHPEPRAVSAEIRHNLFLVLKEALNNVVRHAGATEVWLRVEATARELTLAIEDNGRGFSAKVDAAEADGLSNMRQRAQEIGGEFKVDGGAGAGTRVFVRVPWCRPDE